MRAIVPLALAAALLAACSQPPAEVVFKAPAAASARSEVTVAKGDTVYAIARRHGVSIRALIDANHLAPPYTLRVGQRLAIPAVRVHEVGRGDTLYGISRRYGVDMATLARANDLAPPYLLAVGQDLRIPMAGAPPPGPEPVAAPAPAAAPEPRAVAGVPPVPPPKPAVRTAAAAPAAPPPTGASDGFLWPVSGKLVAGFGPKGGGRHNDGINIAAPRGTAVRAAADGVVAYAGNELQGYGNLVLIRHPGGWVTAYAHNDALLVGRGDAVRRGQVIARVGATGNVAAPQTHFELRRGTRSVDPVAHLVWN